MMAKLEEEMNQRAHAATPNSNPPVMEKSNPPQRKILIHIPVGAPGSVPPIVLNLLLIEVDDQQYASFSPRVAFIYDVFSPLDKEVEKRLKPLNKN